MHAPAPTLGIAPGPTLLLPHDLAAITALLHAVDTPPGFMVPRSEADLLGHLSGTRGVGFGVFGHGRLLAMALLRLPRHDEPAPTLAFPRVPPEDWPGGCAGMEGALVHPDARGLGLQRACWPRGCATPKPPACAGRSPARAWRTWQAGATCWRRGSPSSASGTIPGRH